VSSNSCADGRAPVAELLELSLEELRAGCPAAHTAIVRRLGETIVRITVDDEMFDVRVEDDATRVFPAHGLADVSIMTSRRAVAAVLAGASTLADAVRADEVCARGRLFHLVSVLAALEAFVHGAVRCGGIAHIYDEFQRERAA
jgi:hypothetical protein